jgi:hypothetical protein
MAPKLEVDMKRINEFKGYRSHTEYDPDAGSFVTRRADDGLEPQRHCEDAADIEIKHPPESEPVESQRVTGTPVRSATQVSPVFGMSGREMCEARIMFDMVAAIGSRNVIKVAC